MRNLKCHNQQQQPPNQRSKTTPAQINHSQINPSQQGNNIPPLQDDSMPTEEPAYFKSIYRSNTQNDGLANQVYYLDDEINDKINLNKQPISNLSTTKGPELNMNKLMVKGLLWSAEPSPDYSPNKYNDYSQHQSTLELVKNELTSVNTISNLLSKSETSIQGEDSPIGFSAIKLRPISSRKDKSRISVGSYFGVPEIDDVFKSYFPISKIEESNKTESQKRKNTETDINRRGCTNKIRGADRRHNYGFPLGTIHTLHPLSPDQGMDLPHGLTIATILARNGINYKHCVFWIGNECWPTPYAFLSPTGLNRSLIDKIKNSQQSSKDLLKPSTPVAYNKESVPLDPNFLGELLIKRSIFLNPKDGKELISCIESCLTSTSGNIVIAYISKTTAKQLGFATARRLSIAARENNTLGYLLCQDTINNSSFSFNSSWGIKPIASSDSTQSWQLELHKIKGALPKIREWRINTNSDQSQIRLNEDIGTETNTEPISIFATN